MSDEAMVGGQNDRDGFVMIHTKDLTVVHMRGMFRYPQNGLLPHFPPWPTWEAANRELQAQKSAQPGVDVDFPFIIVPVSVLRAFKLSAKD